jgi:hypothetical protein
VPLQAEVATIDEGEELADRPPPRVDELVFTDRMRELLPKVPKQVDSFRQLQSYMEHSESLSELQLYMEDLYSKLNGERGKAFFALLQEACALVDEVNMITREVRPEDRLHFEVEFVWDIYRDIGDILMIRNVRQHGVPEEEGSDLLLYWTYAHFRERLDVMREVYHTYLFSRRWLGRGDPVDDPWIESVARPISSSVSPPS